MTTSSLALVLGNISYKRFSLYNLFIQILNFSQFIVTQYYQAHYRGTQRQNTEKGTSEIVNNKEMNFQFVECIVIELHITQVFVNLRHSIAYTHAEFLITQYSKLVTVCLSVFDKLSSSSF